MIKRNQRYINIVNVLLEFTIFFMSYVLSTYVRFNLLSSSTFLDLNYAWSSKYLIVALVYALFMIVVYAIFKMFVTKRIIRLYSVLIKVFVLNALGIAIIATLLYFTRIDDFSRIAFILYFFISTALIIMKRVLSFFIRSYIRKKGINLKHVLVVGNGTLAQKYTKSVNKNNIYGYKILGYACENNDFNFGEKVCSYEGISDWLEKNYIDMMIIAVDSGDSCNIENVIDICESNGIICSIIPVFHRHFPANPTIDILGETKLINLRATPLDDMLMAGIKRTFDIIASILILIIVSPILVIAIIGTKLSSPGSVVFKQIRVGKGNKNFVLYKFRSMRINNKQNTAWSNNNDDRKTKFGSLLRKTSIDEFPQFINVLKGDMSIIGPRPEVPHFVDKFKNEIPKYMLKHQIRPGITGWAQVNGYRGDTSIVKRINCDLWYIENWSLMLDIKILIKTAFGGMINSEEINLNKSKV